MNTISKVKLQLELNGRNTKVDSTLHVKKLVDPSILHRKNDSPFWQSQNKFVLIVSCKIKTNRGLSRDINKNMSL